MPAFLLGARIGDGGGFEKGPRVGVLGGGHHLVGGAALDDGAVAHDRDIVGDRADDGEVVADEEAGEAVLLLQPADQLEDPGLDGDVESAGGFVGDEQLGVEGEGAGDGDALALAAGELVGEAGGVRRLEVDRLEQLGDAGADASRTSRRA